MEIPISMRAELSAWNDDAGIDLGAWVGCMGSFALAIGYATVFWPEFVEFEDYILRKSFDEASLRGFEEQNGSGRTATEWAMNHLHLADLHHVGCPDMTKDKLVALGQILEEIYRTKLRAEFPERACVVEFVRPEDQEDLLGYQISFWTQRPNEI